RSTTRKPAPGSLSPLASLRARLTPPGLPTINLDGRHRTTKRHPPPDSVRHEPIDSESCTDPRHSQRNFIERETQGYPQTVSVTEGEHPPGGRPGHSV